MNNDFPVLGLTSPQVTRRRPGKPRVQPLPTETLARRAEISRLLSAQIAPLSDTLRNLSSEERQGFFVKLEHDRPVQLSGTGLKALAEPTASVTLAIPTSDDLSALEQKINEFGTGSLGAGGHAPNERLAAFLRIIEQGKPTDRLSDGLFQQYSDLIHQEFVICEIELLAPLPRGERQRASEVQAGLQALQRAFASGVHGTIFEHEQIRGTIRAVIRCTGAMFRRLVEEPQWQTRISWFEERPQFETFTEIRDNFNFTNLAPIESPPDDAPIVCIVDSGVTVGNPFLEPVSREDLFRTFLEDKTRSPYDEFGHGSGTASLAAYYALNLASGATNQGKVWIASARILDENNEIENRLFSKTLAEVVDVFHPLGVRIFNLSANIINRHWNSDSKRTVPRKSWVARAIDKMSRERDIIFVICTGNLLPWHVRNYHTDGKPYPSYFTDPEASISDPAQSALSVTVGAISSSTIIHGPLGTCSAIAQHNQPAPFTRCGPGIAKDVKPELVEFSGNYMVNSEGGQIGENPGLKVPVATNTITPAVIWASGTSCAAPRVSHKLALILRDLEEFGIEHVSAPLLKAFLVNSANYTDGPELEAFKENLSGESRYDWLNVMGYGVPDHHRATYCDPYTVMLFFQGTIQPNHVAFFSVPVPALLAQTGRARKRLTVTVAHAPEVQRWGLERYLGTTFRWSMFRGDNSLDEIIESMSAEEDGGDEHGDSGGELKFQLGTTLRSRGAIQHDVLEWKHHRDTYSSNHYTLAVAAYERWGRTNPPVVPYGVAIRLEDTSRTAEIYTEVESVLADVQVQTRV